MNSTLREGEVLLDRFVLRRCLLATSSGGLWIAVDQHLTSEVLLRVYGGRAGATAAGAGQAHSTVRDTARHDVGRLRRLRHSNVARAHDVHEDDGFLVISIDYHEGALLSTELASSGAMPYADVLASVRPVVHALLDMHEGGSEHGAVDTEHVILAEDRWVLLPRDGTKPHRSDLEQLGAVMADALTGGVGVGRGGELNDYADRLHNGRTVPALLNQLVADLMGVAERRPGGMREVLARFDQLDRMVEQPALHVPTNEPSPVEVRRSEPTQRDARVPVWGIWIGVFTVILVLGVIGVVGWSIVNRDRAAEPVGPVGVEQPPPEVVPGGVDDGAVVDAGGGPSDGGGAAVEDEAAQRAEAARLEAQRRAAELAVDGYLGARSDAESIGAATWGGELFERALAEGSAADALFLDQSYDEAAREYERAASSMRDVIDTSEEALARLLRDGTVALAASESERAIEAFRTALLIDPSHEFGKIGLQRASTLDEVNALLASAREHESGGAFEAALAAYEQAAELDAHAEEAVRGRDRVRSTLEEIRFQGQMTAGMEAFHAGDFETALTRLRAARGLRPGSPQVAGAIEMVEEAMRRRELDALRDRAIALEATESWQDAWNVYRQVLAIDENVAYAQEGKARAETMMQLEASVARYIRDPALLTQPGTREDAQRVIERGRATPNKGPRLTRSFTRLEELVRLANTPVNVTLRSDGKTEVSVYKVGRYGTLTAKDVRVMPGSYTVVGHRRGYKDVRVALVVEPGAESVELEVVCTERIR